MQVFRNKYRALFFNVPGDEKDVGDCLSAGRGFVHVSAEGDLEPCHFASPPTQTLISEKKP